jgi:hypothetical protein
MLKINFKMDIPVTDEAIDEAGDQVLGTPTEVGVHRFRVAEVALRLASPGFQSILKTVRIQAVVNCEPLPCIMVLGDEVDALRILLNIAHLQFRKVPSALPIICLAEVARLCHRYDAAELVSPFVKSWLEPRRPHTHTISVYTGAKDSASILKDHMWIGLVFPASVHLVHAATHYAMSSMSKNQVSAAEFPIQLK